MGDTWVYQHQDLGEPVHVDGSPILRPVVPLIVGADLPAVLGVLDSGSPISVASADLFAFLGVDIEADDPLYEIPLSVGGGFERTPVFRVRLRLSSPGDHAHGVSWSLDLGARSRWRLPFAVLLGQRGWFDSFPSTSAKQLQVSELAVAEGRFGQFSTASSPPKNRRPKRGPDGCHSLS